MGQLEGAKAGPDTVKRELGERYTDGWSLGEGQSRGFRHPALTWTPIASSCSFTSSGSEIETMTAPRGVLLSLDLVLDYS